MARPSAAELKAKKQKKLLIGLLGLLLVVGVFQGPRMLKTLNKKSSATVAAPATTDGTTTTPTAAAATATTPSGQTGGQLRSFRRFALKDPFRAQPATDTTSGYTGEDGVTPAPAAAPAAAPASSPSGTDTLPTGAQADPAVPAIEPATTTSSTASSPAPAPASAPAKPTKPVTFTAKRVPPNAALIKLNGSSRLVSVGQQFPNADPLFKIVSLGKDNVKIGVVGGSFTSGPPTLDLASGKNITLANVSDGSRYVLELVKLTTIGATAAPAATPTDTSTTTAAPAAATPAPAQAATTTGAAPEATPAQTTLTSDRSKQAEAKTAKPAAVAHRTGPTTTIGTIATTKSTLELTGAGRQDARRVIAQKTDFAKSGGWQGGTQRTSTTQPFACGSLPGSTSGIDVNGYAMSAFKTDGAVLHSHAAVLATPAMVAADWQRTVAKKAYVGCVRASLAKVLPHGTTTVLSVTRRAVPRIGTRTAAFRAIVRVKTPLGGSMQQVYDLLLFTSGQTELNVWHIAPAASAAQLDQTGLRVARAMAARAAS